MWPENAWQLLKTRRRHEEYQLLDRDLPGGRAGTAADISLADDSTLLALWVPVFFGFCWLIALAIYFPFPTTIQPFIALSFGVFLSTFFSCSELLWTLCTTRKVPRWSRKRWWIWTCITASFTFTCLVLGVRKPFEPPRLPKTSNERYFLAANLYNNEAVLPAWSTELLRLIEILGTDRVFVSIAESNSLDQTPLLLNLLQDQFKYLNVRHRIDMRNETGRQWPYGSSPERIEYLARVRNRALEPLQSQNDSLRLANADQYSKIIFFNDVFFNHKSVLELLSTCLSEDDCDYDLVCATDFSFSGLYDSWVSRDRCGKPFIPFWPYVKDAPSRKRLYDHQPFEVASCWNGLAILKAQPFLRPPPQSPKTRTKRGWKSVDDYDEWTSHPKSDPVLRPLQFHATPNITCDASECFLLSYDIHRLAPAGSRPRIWMNPNVKVAYEKRWYVWHNSILQVPYVKAWLRIWSHGYPLDIIYWIFELTRKKEACRWNAFKLPEDCPPLPGPGRPHWGLS